MMKPIAVFTIFCLTIGACFTSKKTTSVAEFAQQINAHRQYYKAEFLSEARSPLKVQDTAYLDFFAPDLVWRVKARFTLTENTAPFDLPTYSGITRKYRQYGALTFEISSKTYQLNLYQNLTLINNPEYKDYLFLPFKDHTNGETSYGGGRYMDFRTADIKDGKYLELDFNKAYNPYCAYSDGYNCPIPPVSNHLDIGVMAGEKLFRGGHKH